MITSSIFNGAQLPGAPRIPQPMLDTLVGLKLRSIVKGVANEYIYTHHNVIFIHTHLLDL